VFVVGCLGDWRSAGKVLFKPDCLSGDPPPSREKGERIAPTVTTGPPFSRTGNERVEAEALVTFSPQNSASNGLSISEHTVPTLQTTKQSAVAIPIHDQATRFSGKRGEKQDGKGNGFGIGEDGAPMNTLTRGDRHAVAYKDYLRFFDTFREMKVRRLTPRECERLQGFPDDWTRIQWKGKKLEECPDGHRYKAMGNSMAVPVMRWIGQQIKQVEEE